MGRISWVFWALFVVAAPLFLITASVTWAFNSPGVYNDGFEKYSISRITGITDADLRQVGADIRQYFNSGDEPLTVKTRILGEQRDLFNDQEISHMKDVKRLVRGVYVLAVASAVYLAIMVIIGFGLHRGWFVPDLAKRLTWAGSLTLILLVVFGIAAWVGFDTVFLKFHELSFTNDFWQLDPRTDYLVRIFPQNFWFDATMWVAIRVIAGGLILTVAGSSYFVYGRYTGWRRTPTSTKST